jgi:hypothetical protein
MSLTKIELDRSSIMADNIGTQLAAKLEGISRIHSVMSSLSVIGTCIRDMDGFQEMSNVFVYMETLHHNAFDELDFYLRKKVIPIVAHINDGV